MNAPALFQQVLETAFAELRSAGIDVFSFALYHDHESHAVSVCVDTEANSWRAVDESNRYNAAHFQDAIAQGDLQQAALWQANAGGRAVSPADGASLDRESAGDSGFGQQARSPAAGLLGARFGSGTGVVAADR